MKKFIPLFLAVAVAAAPLFAAPHERVPRGVKEVTTPDADAQKVTVSVSADRIALPNSIEAGKIAFVVKNSTREKLEIEVKASELKRNFHVSLAARGTRIFQAQLAPGVYQASCVISNGRQHRVMVNLSVR